MAPAFTKRRICAAKSVPAWREAVIICSVVMVPAFTAAMLAITSLMPPLIITRSSPVKVLLARKLSICSFTVSVVLLPAASGLATMRALPAA